MHMMECVTLERSMQDQFTYIGKRLRETVWSKDVRTEIRQYLESQPEQRILLL